MDQATYNRLLAKAKRTIDLFTFDEFIRFWRMTARIPWRLMAMISR